MHTYSLQSNHRVIFFYKYLYFLLYIFYALFNLFYYSLFTALKNTFHSEIVLFFREIKS